MSKDYVPALDKTTPKVMTQPRVAVTIFANTSQVIALNAKYNYLSIESDGICWVKPVYSESAPSAITMSKPAAASFGSTESEEIKIKAGVPTDIIQEDEYNYLHVVGDSAAVNLIFYPGGKSE